MSKPERKAPRRRAAKKGQPPLLVASLLEKNVHPPGPNMRKTFGLSPRALDAEVMKAFEWVALHAPELAEPLRRNVFFRLAEWESTVAAADSRDIRLVAVPVSGPLLGITVWAAIIHHQPERMPMTALGDAEVVWFPLAILPREAHDWGAEDRAGLLSETERGTTPQDRRERVLGLADQSKSASVDLTAWVQTMLTSPLADIWTTRLLVGFVLADALMEDEEAMVPGFPWLTPADVFEISRDFNEHIPDEEHMERADEHEELQEADRHYWRAQAAGIGANLEFGTPGDIEHALVQRIALQATMAQMLDRKTEASESEPSPFSAVHFGVKIGDGAEDSMLKVGLEDMSGRVWGPWYIDAFEHLDPRDIIRMLGLWSNTDKVVGFGPDPDPSAPAKTRRKRLNLPLRQCVRRSTTTTKET